MIGDLGLLTREGMDHFYSIFKDMENWRTPRYDDPFPNDPFPNKPRGPNAEEIYRQKLVEVRLLQLTPNTQPLTPRRKDTPVFMKTAGKASSLRSRQLVRSRASAEVYLPN